LLNTLRSSLREFNLVNCPSVPVKQEIRFNGIKIERGKDEPAGLDGKDGETDNECMG